LPGGRPTKYSKKYCKIVLEKMKNGGSVISCCAEIGIARDTFYNWARDHPEFSDTYKMGMVLAESWWENIGKMGAVGLEISTNGRTGRVNPSIYSFFMKNRFGWTDRVEQMVDATVKTRAADMSPEERDSRLEELLAKTDEPKSSDPK